MNTELAESPAPASELDAGILRFWEEFVRSQIAAGRRDVGAILEMALAFYFERTVQSTAEEQKLLRRLAACQSGLQAEVARLDKVLRRRGKAAAGPGEAFVPAAAPLELELAKLRARLLPVAPSNTGAEPLPAALTSQAQMQDYRTHLAEVQGRAQQVLQYVSREQVKKREAVGRRLQVLSPQLYQVGQKLCQEAGEVGGSAEVAAVAAASPPPSPPATASQRLRQRAQQALGEIKERAGDVLKSGRIIRK